MASPLVKTLLLATIMLAYITGFGDCHGSRQGATGKHSAHRAIGRHSGGVRPQGKRATGLPKKQNKPRFKPGPWCQAFATFYEGSSSSFGGACNYKDVVAAGYGYNTAAVSSTLFNNGQACGACYELKCARNPKWCKPGQPSLILTATDHCPPNPSLPSDNGGWCNPPRQHFDIAKPVFNQLADYTAGIIPVDYRRVPCQKKGGIRFTINGNPWFYQVTVWNVAAAGDVVGLVVKGNDKLKWTEMQRDWGTTWKTSAILQNEALTFRVKTSDGRASTSWHVTPKNWQFGQTFEGKNFR
ncbi:expansin A4 [Euphorbia peplus]|nr:expansin A4 [Euphorbia peplus]